MYVFLGKCTNLIQFTTAMQKMDLLKSHYILAANLEAHCFENNSSQYLFGKQDIAILRNDLLLRMFDL